MNPFNPAFIKRIDKFLLQNHPLVWVTRIHYVVLYGIYLFSLSFLLGLVFPINIIDPYPLSIYYLLFILISIALYVIWIYKNSIFNIENRFGNRSIWDEYKLFFLYFFTITLLCTNYLPFQYVNEQKMANAISDEDYVRELNVLNLADPFFVSATYDYEQDYDTIKDHDYYNYSVYTRWNKFTPSYYNYGLFRSYDYENPATYLNMKGGWSDSVLQAKFDDLNTDERKLAAIQDYLLIFKKYGREIPLSPQKILSIYKYYVSLGSTIQSPPSYYDENPAYYIPVNKEDIISAYRNVGEAKFGKVYYRSKEFGLIIFYLVFYCTVFFMMFRNVRWQQFLIALVAMAIVPIVLGILFQIFRFGLGHHDADDWFSVVVLLIYLGLFIYSIIFRFACPKAYSPFASILLQMANLCTPVAFFFIVVFAQEFFGAFHYHMPYELNLYDIYYEGITDQGVHFIKNYPNEVKSVLFHREVQSWWHACYERWMMWAQILGMVFYVGIYMPYMKEQFTRLKALPRKK